MDNPVFWEDFEPGAEYELGTVIVTEEEILEFGRRYDPQPFHVDGQAATESCFGGLIASGWLTASLYMRLYVDGLLRGGAGEGSPGVDEIRYHRPVRAGDKLSARFTVLDRSPSLMRPQTGVVRPRCEFRDQDGNVVFSMILHSIFRRR